MEATAGSTYSQTLIDNLSGLDIESFLGVIRHVLNDRGDLVLPLVSLLVPDIIYPPASILEDRRCEGTITSYFPDKNFGYISCPTIQEEFEKDCIVLKSQLRGFSVGSTVNFAVCLEKANSEPVAYDLHTVKSAVKAVSPQAENIQDARILALNAGPGDQRAGTMQKNNGSFGFIKQDNGELDMFVMPQGCVAGVLPPKGARVVYTIAPDEKTGRPRAENVTFEDPSLSAVGNDSGAANPFNTGNGYGAARPGRATPIGNSLCVAWQSVKQGGSVGQGMRSQPYPTPTPKPVTKPDTHGQSGQFDQNQFGLEPSAAMPGDLRLGTMIRDQGGFGFIKQDGEAPDMFILPAACSAFGGILPALGARVQYYVVNDGKTGRPRADGASPASDLEGAQLFDQTFGQDPTAATPVELCTGTMYRDQGTFGFIKQDSGGPEMFVMPAACSAFGGVLPAVGVRMAYYVVNDGKTGRPRAEGAYPVYEDGTTPNPHALSQFGQDFGGAQPFDLKQFGQDYSGAVPGELCLGTMLRVSDHGGFGFIKQDGEGPDMFIMPAACSAFGGVLPALGVRVQYCVVIDEKTGRPRADGACPVSI